MLFGETIGHCWNVKCTCALHDRKSDICLSLLLLSFGRSEAERGESCDTDAARHRWRSQPNYVLVALNSTEFFRKLAKKWVVFFFKCESPSFHTSVCEVCQTPFINVAIKRLHFYCPSAHTFHKHARPVSLYIERTSAWLVTGWLNYSKTMSFCKHNGAMDGPLKRPEMRLVCSLKHPVVHLVSSIMGVCWISH